ncbi:hypothetical protein LIA77_09977 [Sarocladium implicatum]|nr:hypothetical protein LIA77_09977 [Sarocladium implicatum]
MPVSEDQPEFLHEVWALYAVGVALLVTRFVVRLQTVGFRGLQLDDLFSFLVLLFYTGDAVTVHLIYFLGTNVEAAFVQLTRELTASELSDYTLGSKLQITAWYTYTALLWCLKGTMLAFFARMTIGTWHKRMVNYISIICAASYVAVFLTLTFGCFPTNKNWQVVPDPGLQCTFKKQNFIVTTVFNVVTDAMILCIPLPLLWTLQVPLKKKLVVGLLLSSGIFVIAAAIIRVVLTTTGSPSAIKINSWGVRETIVGIFTVNIPILRPMFSRNFWDRNATSITTGGTGTKSGKGTISGPYELTARGQDGTSDFKGQANSSAAGSQEYIFGKTNPDGVMVHTSYKVTSDEESGHHDGEWVGTRGGVTKASVKGGLED